MEIYSARLIIINFYCYLSCQFLVSKIKSEFHVYNIQSPIVSVTHRINSCSSLSSISIRVAPIDVHASWKNKHCGLKHIKQEIGFLLAVYFCFYVNSNVKNFLQNVSIKNRSINDGRTQIPKHPST